MVRRFSFVKFKHSKVLAFAPLVIVLVTVLYVVVRIEYTQYVLVELTVMVYK
jgi:hypothetical protein